MIIMSKKRIAILGSSGTIGVNTLKVCKHLSSELEVVGLSVRNSINILEDQIRRFHPKVVSVADAESAEVLRSALADMVNPPEILSGSQGLVDVAVHPDVDIVVVATVGSIGLLPTLEAIRAGKTIALANKEVLVMAGELVMQAAYDNKTVILPVDSEHNAIFQCLSNQLDKRIRRILLTASGGPFRTYTGDFKDITLEMALKHPTWTMGKKITIDSATLMNKGFELIEATHLFDVTADMIEVVIHPQSIVHSLVEFVDGSILAQMGITDMFMPIQYALTYPKRMETPFPPLDLTSKGQLTFEKPNLDKFPCLRFAYEVSQAGGTFPAVLNAANEVAVARLLDQTLKFYQVPAVIEETLQQHLSVMSPQLDAILDADKWARRTAQSIVEKFLR